MLSEDRLMNLWHIMVPHRQQFAAGCADAPNVPINFVRLARSRYGMHMGFIMRQQCIAAVQAKVLRLNSAAIANVTTGKVLRV